MEDFVMENKKNYRDCQILTAKEVQKILKLGNKTVYRLFEEDCPFRYIKLATGYQVHAKSFFDWLDGNVS